MRIRTSFLFGLASMCLFFLSPIWAYAQEKKDSLKLKNVIKDSRLSREIVGALTKEPMKDTIFNQKSEDAFLPYQGKIIRNIIVDHLGFERNFYGGRKTVRKTIVNLGNTLHKDTREQVIQENLFIRKNRPLNAYRVADNERYLRDLNFILDARIEVYPVAGSDSVDLIVITRDVFSLGGKFSPKGANEASFGIYDANLLGYGQRVEYNGNIDGDYTPSYGQEFIYEKSSIGGTLVNLTMGYSSINTGSSYGDEFENATYLKLTRPLLSPYSRVAGGFELSNNWSSNVSQKPDSLFLKYAYDVYDLWTGYNIGINNVKTRNRHFVALRWFRQNFKQLPSQEVTNANPLYNDNSFVLSQFTFFQQNFYKTRYIYGFGRTEDVPYGHTAQITAGWTNQLGRKRFYTSAGITKKVVTKQGDFFEGNIQAATFHNNGAEDATLLFAFSWFSRLRYQQKLMIRQYLKSSYTIELNRSINPLLEIGNEFGVKGFNADSLRGAQRLSISSETVLFTPWNLLGFKFAPIVYADIAFLPPLDRNIFYDKPYVGIGMGMRTRNENLIFGTIELRITFYPKIVEDISHFKVSLSSNLRVKFSDSFVRAPDFIKVN